jgi:amino acid transporter
MIARTVVVDRIKLPVAALVFVIGMCAVGGLVAAPLFDRHSKLAAALVLIAFFALLVATMALFNIRARPRRVPIAELEVRGLLNTAS